MQTRPDHSTLLEALAQFLLDEIAPRLEADKGLQFRVLIAANLAAMVAGEARTLDARAQAERQRLRALMPDVAGDDLEALNHELVLRLRARSVDAGAALDHLLTTARETLEVINPRFELSEEV